MTRALYMLIGALLLNLEALTPPRPTRDGLAITAGWGCIVEHRPLPLVGDQSPACRVDGGWDWFDHENVAQVIQTGLCIDYPDVQPKGLTFAAFLTGTMTLHEFIEANPDILLGWEGGAWYWTNARRECELGTYPPPWHEVAPAYVLRYARHEFWGGACDGEPVLIRCPAGAAFSWVYMDGNRQAIACGMGMNAVVTGSTPGYSACDADFNGLSNVTDWGIFVAAPWDWDGDGLVSIADVAGFQGCLWP